MCDLYHLKFIGKKEGGIQLEITFLGKNLLTDLKDN
jgi:hypothetical protein